MKRAFLVPAAALVAAPAFAQQAAPEPARLKEVTVSATRTENPADEVPATVSVIRDERIEREMVQDARDLVRYEPNVSVRSEQSRRFGNASFNIRGIEGNRVLMLLDGIRVPDEFSFSASLLNGTSRDLVEMETLKRVEILRGAGSPLYGSDAIGGVVSFTTKDPADLLRLTDRPWYAGWKGSYAGADRSLANHFSVAAGRGDVQGMLWYTDRRGHETENKGTVGGFGDARTLANPQTNESQNLLGKLVLKPASGHTVKLTGEHRDGRAQTDVLTGNPSVASDLSLAGEDSSRRSRLSLEHEWLKPWSWVSALRWNLHAQASRTFQKSTERRTTPAVRETTFQFDQDSVGGGLQLESRLDFGSHAHRLSYGFDLVQTATSELRDGFSVNPNTGVVTKVLFPDTFPARDFPDTDTRLFGAFLQDEIALAGGRLLLTPGVRLDSFRIDPKPDAIFTTGNPTARLQVRSDSAVSPKLGALWKFNPVWSAYGQVAKGFRAPPALDLFGAFANAAAGYTFIPNLDLKPERSTGFEAGVRAGSDPVDASVAVFSNRYQDFIATQQALACPADPACVAGFPFGTFQSRNLSRVRISGLEARTDWRIAQGWGLAAAFGSARGRDQDTGKPINTIDPAKLAAGLRYESRGGNWGGQFAGTFVSRVDDGDVDDTSAHGFRPGGYQVFDLTGWVRFDKRVSLHFGIFNIGDEKYWHWSDVRLLSSSATAAAPFLNTAAGAGREDRYSNPGRNVSVSLRVDL
ncbi:MAG: TonB-dependent hemoglobin/transferrin/lactoferrin family receptor [Betaproteobacteria bacterium]